MTANIQLSGKANNGIIFVVGGDTFDDFFANLVATLDGDAGLADSTVKEAARLIVPASAGGDGGSVQQAAANIAAAFPQATPAPQAAPRQAPTGAPPGQQAPLCDHGYARVYKSGVSKAGKPYKMWSCPADRSEQCEPQWVR